MARKKELCSSENHEPGAGIVRMKLEELHSFEGHPFKVERNQELFELRCSIEKEGVLVPLLVRKNPYGDGYEIIAGHRRKEAALWAGFMEVPVIIRELDDDQSVIAMVDSNLQREKILPSEKAFAYKMRLEAMKHQGRAEADTSDPLEPKYKTELVNVSELEAELQELGKVKIQKKGGAGAFHLDISKEGLENEFNGNRKKSRDIEIRDSRVAEELRNYYRELDTAIAAAGGITNQAQSRKRSSNAEFRESERVHADTEKADTDTGRRETDDLIRQAEIARRSSEINRRNSASDNRTVRNAEAESIASAEQRRSEKQKWFEEQERARAARRRNKRRSEPEL